MKKYNKYLLLFLVFIALFLICYLFPYVHDDWAWGSSVGMDRFNSGFTDYGGRYFGYLIVMAMTRSKIVAAFIMSSVLVGIGVCVKRLVDSWWAFGATLILIFLLPKEVFAQSVSWVSGFANYATTTLVVLIFLNIVKDIIIDKKKEGRLSLCLMPIIGFSGSLIVENITVYLVIMCIILQIYLFVKEKRFSWSLFLLMLGASVGAAWMFSNSAYQNVLKGEDGYRTAAISTNGLMMRMKDNYIDTIYSFGLLKNTIINIVITLGGVLFIIFSNSKKRSTMIGLSIFCAYTVYVIFSEIMLNWASKPNVVLCIEGVFSLIALIGIMIFSIGIAKKDSNLRKIFGLLWISFLMVLGPLLIVTPIGPRNFLISDLLLIIIGLLFWREGIYYFSKIDRKVYRQLLYFCKKIGIIVALSVWIIFVSVFIIISRADNRRLQDIR